MELDGKVAIVTGGASGIGLATTRRLSEAGAWVVVADVDVDGGERAAAVAGGRFVALDVTDPDAWTRTVAEILDSEGRLDVAHLNAGVALGVSDLATLDVAAYRRIIGVNVDGVVFGLRAVLPAIRDGGAILATASLGGLTPMPVDPIYSATKHAVVALMRSIAPGLADRGITANALCPGYADTGLVTDELREAVDALDVPLIDPDVVAEAALEVLTRGGTGEAWFVQPGREPAPYAFRGVPGPGTA